MARKKINARNKKYLRAIKLYSLALEMFQRLYESDHPYIALTLLDLSWPYRQIGLFRKARKLSGQGLTMEQRLSPGDNQRTANGLIKLADSCPPWRPRQARKLREQGLAMEQRLYPGDHLEIVRSLIGLARSYPPWRQRVRELCEQALAMTQRLYPGDNQMTSNSLIELANSYPPWRQRARELCEQALAMEQRLYQGDHREITRGLYSVAFRLMFHGHLLKAAKLYRESFLMARRIRKSSKTAPQ